LGKCFGGIFKLRLIVTGGSGFIGSNFIRLVLENHDDYKVTNVDKLTYAGNVDNTKDFENNPNYKFVKEDINSKEMHNLVKDCDAIVNFAAESHVDNSINSSEIFFHSNVLGTLNLLEAARKSDKKFLQVSTDEVYGQIKEGTFTEKSKIKPRNPYSVSKASADLLTQSYWTTYKLPVLTTRSSNNFGPYQHTEKLIPKFVTNLLKGIKVPLYGDGKNVRDWLFVEDNCRGIGTVLHKAKPGSIYNIGGDSEKENIEVTKFLLNELGLKEDMIDWVEDRLGHDFRYSLDSSKLKQDLGWSPKTNFEDAMRLTINWYKEDFKNER
jgi:dTDP-glucose 4,6-dehydratase